MARRKIAVHLTVAIGDVYVTGTSPQKRQLLRRAVRQQHVADINVRFDSRVVHIRQESIHLRQRIQK